MTSIYKNREPHRKLSALASALVLLILSLLAGPTDATFSAAITSNDASYTVTINAPAPQNLNFGPKSWSFGNFSGRLVSINVSAAEKQGAAILLPWASGFSFEKLVRQEYNLGVAAVVTGPRLAGGVPGWSMFYFDGSDVRDIKIPVVEIPRLVFAEIFHNVSAGATANVSISCCDVNEWEVWNSSGWMIGFSVVTGGFSIIVFGLAFFKLVVLLRQYFSSHKSKFSIGLLVLVIICIGNIFRSVYLVVDPVASRRTIPNPWLYILWSFSFPFTIIASLSVTFYWLELITQTKVVVVSSFLNRLLWPFIGASFFILTVEVASSSLRGLNYSVPTMLFITGVSYVVIISTVTLLFIITGVKVLRQLKSGSSSSSSHHRHHHSSKSTRLKRATTKLMLSTIGLVGSLICALLVGLTETASLLKAGHALWLYLFLSMCFSDLMLVLAVRAPFKQTHSSHKSETPENADPSSTSLTPLPSRKSRSTRESIEPPLLSQTIEAQKNCTSRNICIVDIMMVQKKITPLRGELHRLQAAL